MDSLGRASGSIELRADGALRALDQVARGLQDLQKQSTSGLTGLAQGIDKNSQSINAMGQIFTAVGGAVLGTFGLMTNTASSFEASMDGVAASLGGIGTEAGVTEAQFKALSDEALRVGSTTSKSATEAAQAMDLMARAGINVETIINGGAQAVVNLSEATSESLNQSAATVSSLFLLFEDTGISVTQMADSITAAMNNSDASMSEFQTGMARLAPVVKGGSLSFEEAAASIAYFNQQGFSAAETGTSLSSIFTSVMTPATEEAAEALRQHGIVATDANGAFIGFPALFEQIATATAGMTEEQRANFFATAFMTDAHDLLGVATGETRGELEALEEEIARSGTAATASATRMDNLRGDVEQLGGAFETLSIRVGSFAIPAFRQVAQVITSVITAIAGLPAPILGAIGAIGAIVGAMTLLTGVFLLFLPKAAEIYLAVQQFRAWGGISRVVNGLAVAFRGLAAAMLFNPVVLGVISVALAGLLAYRTNFLGFADAVHAFKVQWDGLIQMRDPISAFFGALGAALRSFDVGILDALASKLEGIGYGIQSFLEAFRNAGGAVEAKMKVSFEGDDKVIEWQEQEDGSIKYAIMQVNAETGELEAVGEILESYDDPNDPNLIHAKIKTDDGEFWTTIDRATSEVHSAEIEVTADAEPALSMFDRIDAGLAAMQDRFARQDMSFFAAMTGAARIAVNGVEGLLTVLNNISPAIQNWIIGIGAALTAIRPLMAIGGMVARTLSPLLMVLRGVGIALALLASPVGLVVLGIAALVAGAIYAYKNFEPFRKIVDQTAAALRDFATGPALDFISDLANGFMDGVDAVRDFMGGVESVQDFFRDLLGVIANFRRDVATAFSIAAAAVGPFRETIQMVGTVIDGVISIAMSLLSSLAALIRGDVSGAWALFQQALQTAFDTMIVLLGTVGQLLIDTFQAIPWTDLWNGLTDAWDAIPWGQMASTAVDLLIAGLRGAGGAAAGVFDWLRTEVTNALSNAWEGIQTGLQLAWNQITSLSWGDFIPVLTWASYIVGKIADFGTWLWDKIKGGFNTATSYISGSIADFAGWVWEKIKSIFPSSDLITGNMISDFAGWVWTKIENIFPSSSMISGAPISDIADWVWGKIKGFFPSASVILGAIADFGAWLWGKIENLFPDVGLQFPSKTEILAAIASAIVPNTSTSDPDPKTPNDTGYTDDTLSPPSLPGMGGFMGAGDNPLAGLKEQIETGLAEVTRTIERKTAEWGAALSAGLMPIPATTQAAFAPIPLTVGASLGAAAMATTMHTGAMLGTAVANFTGVRTTGTTNVTLLGASVLGSIAGTAAGWGASLAGMLGSATANFSAIRATGTSNAASMGASVAASVGSMAANVGSRLGGMASSAIGTMSNMRGASVGQAISMGSGIAAGIGNGAANALSRLAGSMGQMAGVIASSGGAAVGTAAAVGANIGAALANGLASMAGRVAGAAANLIAQANAAISMAAGIASPSKLAIWWGHMLGEGFAVGIEDMYRTVARATAGLVSTPALPGYGVSPYAGTVPYAAMAAGGGTVVHHYHSYTNSGDIIIQAADDPERTADVVFQRLENAWVSTDRRGR